MLTIAGSDSGGGAGIQADLQTLAALNCFGTTAVTCLTAQNPSGVSRIEEVDPAMVVEQINMICSGFPVTAAKTGMLFSAGVIKAVAGALRESGIPTLVTDPVMIATSGARLLKDDAIEAMCSEILPLASLITPNLDEAAELCGRTVESVEDMKAAAREIGSRFDASCAVKGGHLKGGDRISNVLFTGTGEYVFETDRVAAKETHGTGCTFSAAAAGLMARGMSVQDAVRGAGEFVFSAMLRADRAGAHRPLNWPDAGLAVADNA